MCFLCIRIWKVLVLVIRDAVCVIAFKAAALYAIASEMKLCQWSILFGTFLQSFVKGQVQVQGKYTPHQPFTQLVLGIQSVISLPPQDNFELLVKDMNEQRAHPKPYKFAEALPVSLDIAEHGEWEDRGDGLRVWKLVITSPGATSIGLLFDDFYLPKGSELFVVGRDEMLGAFTGKENNKEDGKFATTPISGDAVILEYVEPKNKPQDLPVRIRLDYVAHGFRAGPKDYRSSGSCNIDISCSEGDAWRTQARSVAMMITDNGTRFCTGAMINNVQKDGSQFFLTANHCIIGDVSRLIMAFNYESATCNRGGNLNSTLIEPKLQTVQGVKLLSRFDKSDFALLLLTERIPEDYNVYLAGWELAKRAPANVVGIHHPSGDVKKISIFTGNLTASSWQEGPLLKYHWNIDKWTLGITEPGSSGSPLFNQAGLIVGHLHGGQSSCQVPDGYDMYGGIGYDWSTGITKARRLRDWLNPQGRAVSAMLGMELNTARKNVQAGVIAPRKPVARAVAGLDRIVEIDDSYIFSDPQTILEHQQDLYRSQQPSLEQILQDAMYNPSLHGSPAGVAIEK